AVGLDEADRRQRPGLRSREELLLVPQVRAAGLPLGVAREVAERLVVELEQAACAVGVDVGRTMTGVLAAAHGRPVGPAGAADVAGRVVPASGVPRPRHVRGAELVADV